MLKPFFENKKKIEEIIRVNHAGELGAKKIYEGQLSTISKEYKELIQEMLDQELVHLKYFENQILTKNIRPSALIFAWNIVGTLVGKLSAKLGIKKAMIITEAVEQVIERHYQDQIDFLEQTNYKDQDLLNNIKKFQKDEQEHKHIAMEFDSNLSFIDKTLFTITSNLCKLAIFISKKI